jgi:Cd2+/Zn2+-exporting ATPase
VPLAEPKDFAETAGRGVKAQIDAHTVMIGRAQWLKDNGVRDEFTRSVDLNETEGFSLIFVARDGKCIGWIGLQDQTRTEAAEALAELKESGVRRIAMISGDRQPVASRVAKEIGCEEAVGDCLPQTKVDFVRTTKAKGYRVAVVGDGVNDAPALGGADVGVAIGAELNEVALGGADVALLGADLGRLPRLLELADGTRKIIAQNVWLAFGLAVVLIALAARGVLDPLAGALAQSAAVLVVVANSARLLRLGRS